MAVRVFQRLASLLDVALSSPADGEVLTYSSASSKWENQAAGGGGGTPAVQVATVHVSSAEILDLFANPVNIVEAPGAGKAVLPITGLAIVRAGATPYTFPDYDGNTSTFALEVLPAFMGAPLTELPLTSAVDAVHSLWMAYSGEVALLASVEDQPLVFHVGHGDVTDGDGTLDFVISYIVIDIP